MFTEYKRGMLMISVEGINLERFINKCNAKRVTLQGMATIVFFAEYVTAT